MDYQRRVFSTLFPTPWHQHTTPTPVSTPDLGHSARGSSFSGPSNTNVPSENRAVKRNAAWSTATRFLSLPRDTAFDLPRVHKNREIEAALQYLLAGEGKSQGAHEQSLIDWYTNEARIHFATLVRPVVESLWEEVNIPTTSHAFRFSHKFQEIPLSSCWKILEETQRSLEQVQNIYLQPFNGHLLPILIHSAQSSASATRSTKSTDSSEVDSPDAVNRTFRRDLHSVFVHCIPLQRYAKTIEFVLYDSGCNVFRMESQADGFRTTNRIAHRSRMVKLLRGLERVGLGGESTQKAFGHAMHKLLDEFIYSEYQKVDWVSKDSVVPYLRQWVEDGFCPFVELVMECLKCDPSHVLPTELQQWQDMALGRLGRCRVERLFDFVLNLDMSLGAIRDLKHFLKAERAKQTLTASFSQQVTRRLLHAGATTTYILNVYISIIKAFHELEPNGVLLERVARPIRRYLKERADTARIIITSLLTDVDEDIWSKPGAAADLSLEIAKEMTNSFANFNQDADEELNWNDMNWQPLPSDASPDYKKSKVQDVIWFLLTLWDREDFVSELKNIFGDHLLRCQDPDYVKEIRLLELIKIRLGDDKLQACEVMLRDVLESRRINATIQNGSRTDLRTPDQHQGRELETPDGPGPRTPRPRRPNASGQTLHPPATPSSEQPDGPKLNAQIVSSFFWPLLRDDEFRVPAQVQGLQKQYESRFEQIKGMRKLRWMNALGDVSITLEFDDRTEEFEKLTPWQVSVVHAFQPQPGEEWAEKGKKEQGITRNIDQVVDLLQMDEDLVRRAVAFWVGKSVLRQVSPDTYTVIERLTPNNQDSDAAAAAQELAEVQAQEATAVKSQADLLMEKKDVYMNFIFGMLTVQRKLPVSRIHMMLRSILQGGFPFGEAEVRTLLALMEKEERAVELGGDVWSAKK
ncbi:hypothetical protein BS50DRAFT_638154 [Corynespora cassiicola Philippines]|uniref:Anaphase-promoting complex subunit 2 n=1 Tax=Corynespora cassiicola Philippines TaxID=1448308 RepID=A0A2T2NAP2_CORCC|nr:hypothetical protein BS50DRAFT_638154 [Corynespora cassiicola Philippines]